MKKFLNCVKNEILHIRNVLNTFSNKVYNLVFDQLFFISTILIAFAINSFFSSEATNLLGPIKFLVENRVYAISIVTVWGIVCFIKNASDLKSKEICELKDSIKNKDRQIESNSGVLEGKYGEFADAIQKNNINKVLEKVVKSFPLVEACHLYSYQYNRIKNNVDIKINFLHGYEQEGVCINVLKQKYYSIDKNIFNKLKELINKGETIKESKFHKKISELEKLIAADKCDESIKYRLRQIIFGIICTKYHAEGLNVGLKEDREKKFIYRTGILGAILSPRKGYMYSYQGNKETKSGRIYYSTPIVLKEEFILNIAIDGRNMNAKQLDDFLKTVVNMIKEEYNYIIKGGVATDD